VIESGRGGWEISRDISPESSYIAQTHEGMSSLEIVARAEETKRFHGKQDTQHG